MSGDVREDADCRSPVSGPHTILRPGVRSINLENPRQPQALFLGAVQRDVVVGVGVRMTPVAGSFQSTRSRRFRCIVGAIGADNHARMLAEAHADAAAVMQRDPGGARCGVEERIEERPVGHGVRPVLFIASVRGSARRPSRSPDGRGR